MYLKKIFYTVYEEYIRDTETSYSWKKKASLRYKVQLFSDTNAYVMGTLWVLMNYE